MKPELPVLIEARARIADPLMWGKGKRGASRPFDTYCASEAIRVGTVELSLPLQRSARALFCQAIGIDISDSIPDWNDAPERTHADVLAAFDEAIERAA
jgi:hypothetical protein